MSDKFSGMIGDDKTALVEKGSQMLSSLFGGQQQNALGGAVAKFSGLNAGTGSSLLGIVASVVMGVTAVKFSRERAEFRKTSIITCSAVAGPATRLELTMGCERSSPAGVSNSVVCGKPWT
jgi:hypothetical protein